MCVDCVPLRSHIVMPPPALKALVAMIHMCQSSPCTISDYIRVPYALSIGSAIEQLLSVHPATNRTFCDSVSSAMNEPSGRLVEKRKSKRSYFPMNLT